MRDDQARPACAACRTELPPNSRFCNECGAAVGAAAEPAEFKQVTVLFADVVRSMNIAATVGAERLREIMSDLLGRGAAVVQRYGGTMDKFTGDGLMAVFGAPVAMEDHAIRACLAALGIQNEAQRLAQEIERRDGVALQLRVGLNSGQVVAGGMGWGLAGYTLIGEQVGFAQRMESVAPAGAVMLSESTAQLVEHAAVLEEPKLVHIKGADEPVRARQLLAIEPRHVPVPGTESRLVGRGSVLATIEAALDCSMQGRGGVVGVVGPPGIGKSRIAREAAAIAADREVEVIWTFCESHASDIPFHVVTRLLRATTAIPGMDDHAARAQLRTQMPGADEEDLFLLDDLLGIADPEVTSPKIAPDARRRRLTAMINAASLARTKPALYIIEDAHWVDEVSESMLADFFTILPQTPSMVLITNRPEYRGTLTRVHGAQTIALAPLDDSETAELIGELLGQDPSVAGLAATILSRVGGNPFFAEEIVRDLTERGVLHGHRGAYACPTDVADIRVPATLQATIGARIDRLDPKAKRTLSTASVIGSRFGAELLTTLGVEPVLEELLRGELIDPVSLTPSAEYVFRHPLIRAVAYESQLKADRTEVHRRLAAAIQERAPESDDENAALIAEHLQAGDELRAAYGWRMRAAAWSTNRDIAAARVSWERARQIADALPDDDEDRTTLRIAPRMMLCVSSWRGADANISGSFEELRELCTAAGDKASLAIAMTGLTTALLWQGRTREASRLASEQMTLLESIGNPTLTIGAAYVPIIIKLDAGEFTDALRWSQTVIDLADGDPAKGANFAMGSPLAAALEFRGAVRYWLGRPGWREDLDDAHAMARSSDPVTHGLIVAGLYGFGIVSGVLRADDGAVREIEGALQRAENSSDDTALGSVKYFLGVVLLDRDTLADRDRGLALLTHMRDTWLRERTRLYLVPSAEVLIARENARRGDRDGAIAALRTAVEDLRQEDQLVPCVIAIDVLVETLLDRGSDGDAAEAVRATEQLANLPVEDGSAVRDIWLLRLQALLSRAHGDDVGYRTLTDRYRAMAESLGFEGHMAMAEAMTSNR